MNTGKNIYKLFNTSVKYNLKNIIEKNYVRNYTPRRALLYVPGDSEKKIKKTFSLNVDCVVFDCEDGVAQNKKQAAREMINSLFNKDKQNAANTDLAVRINSVESGLSEEDIKVIFASKYSPDTIVLPKVNSVGHLKWLFNILKVHMPSNKKVNLIMLIESPLAFINLVEICKYASAVPNIVKPEGLIFGSDDFCASIGAVRTDDSTEILYARQKMVLVAKAFHLQAIDMVYINYKDLEGLRLECEKGMRMGYTGKQLIHPDQVPVAQTAFLPSQKQVEWASLLIKKFKENQKSGVGAFTFEGHMIDMPTLRIAENIIEIAKKRTE